MKLAIMQPYFFPYIGYFQLIAAVDKFIVYDNIKYTKKGWINRNRILQNGEDCLISLPLKKDSDYLDICNRYLAEDFNGRKLLNQIKGAYLHAPYFEQTFPLISQIIEYQNSNLFAYLYHGLIKTCAHLGIETEFIISSDMQIDHGLKSQDKVIALCKAAGASGYINTIGGLDLYSKDVFKEQGLELQFIKSTAFDYTQFDHPFVPWLSIIDVMMFNPPERIRDVLDSDYELI